MKQDFIVFLKSTKKHAMPMHPIVSACGTATYNTAKFTNKILQNYCCKPSSFVKDSTDFIKKIKHLSINPEEEPLVSFDVSALFTSIPVPFHYKLSIPKFLTAPISTRSLQKKSSSFWNSLLPTASSASRNSINNYRVQPWVYLFPLSLQISTWNI